MGDDVIGHVSALPYSAAIENAEERSVREEFLGAAHGKVPSYFGETNYTTAQMIDEVMKKNAGNFPDAAEFVKQLVATEVDAVRGKVSFDGYRNPVQDIYIKKVEKRRCSGTASRSCGTRSYRPIGRSASSVNSTRKSS